MNIDKALDNNVIEYIYDTNITELVENTELKKYWENDYSDVDLLAISDLFNEEYLELKDSKFKKAILKKRIKQYDKLIICVSKINIAFYEQKASEKNLTEIEVLDSYLDVTKMHIGRLQRQCNQLIFRKQNKDFNLALFVAVASFSLSLFSISLTAIYGEGHKFFSKPIEKTENCYPKDTISPQNTQEYSNDNSDKKEQVNE